MLDVYLQFDDKAAADAALAAAGMSVDHGLTWAIDRVGTIYGDPTLGEDGTPTAPGAAVSGYHVNLRLLSGELPSALDSFRVWPATPSRRFAS